MLYHLNKKAKLSLVAMITTLTLTGCGSSSEENQLVWLHLWDVRYESKMEMISVCHQQAGITQNTKRISRSQNDMLNECELSYIAKIAVKDGVILERRMIENNILQVQF